MNLKPDDTLTMKAESLKEICTALAVMGSVMLAAEALREHGEVMGVSPDVIVAAVDAFAADVLAAIDRAKESMVIVPA